MFQFTKILLPVDGSEHSMVAKRKAIGLAQAMGAEIVLLYVTGWIPQFVVGQAREEAMKTQLKEADHVLEPFQKALEEHNINYKTVVKDGTPGDTICETAHHEDCDLVVMGCRGHSNLTSMIFGSVTHKVLSVCDLPVLIAR